MKKKRIWVYIVAAIVIIIAGIGIAISSMIGNYRRQVDAMHIANVSLAEVPDGTCEGRYETLLVSADVRVTVKDHQIKEVELVRHDNGKGAAAEVITDRIVEAQSLEVDIVSGATASSKVILKAVENALTGGASE
jgi:uncharacterized protein with FMN-binding domain